MQHNLGRAYHAKLTDPALSPAERPGNEEGRPGAQQPAQTIIKVICQFCHGYIGVKNGQGLTGTSHGICPICRILPEEEQMKVYKQTIEMETAARDPRRV